LQAPLDIAVTPPSSRAGTVETPLRRVLRQFASSRLALLGLVVLVLDIIALVDIFKSGMPTTNKVLWALAVIFFPVVGMIVYFLVGKK